MLENGKFLIGTGKEQVEARLVAFCDLESQTEYRLATGSSEFMVGARSAPTINSAFAIVYL
ncbi:hypothetical protein OOK60_16770 [Trichothermofontia sichuanensis B231]|uniref:hypothetical protein n=1 Tax=Trichothermofontia sichuanensis TaxID=3045816 RepID=UPI00224503FA|nr:hypothetical protein [Trichothermofontia sichuanensis]UZQ54118.1 hypothetical protein OOK60_16770 [Trichothermofontia sichuanensis B231]